MIQLTKTLAAIAVASTCVSACATPPNSEHYVADIRPYTVTFRNFSADETLSILNAFETEFSGINFWGDHEGGAKAWRQNLSSSLSTSELMREFLAELDLMGLSETEVRVTVREQGQFEIAKLALKKVR